MLSLGFVVLGLGLVGAFEAPWVSPRRSHVVGMTFGWICITFFGACAVVIARTFFDTGPLLRIGSQGVWWKRWSDETVPWSEITDVTIWQHKGQKCLILHLRDPARFPGRGLMGWAGKANRALTGGDIGITLTGTNRSIKDAMAAVEYYRG
jgi:hypothetical protein